MNDVLKQILSKLSNKQEFEQVNTETTPMVRVIRNDERLVDLEPYLRQPRIIEENRTLYTLDSFINYINIYSEGANIENGTPAIFINIDGRRLHVVGVVDFHSSCTQPAHGKNTVKLSMIRDEPFNNWLEEDDRWMSQRDLLSHLKKNSASVSDGYAKLLSSIEEISTETQRLHTETGKSSGKTKSTIFGKVDSFGFNFRPYLSLPFKFKIVADLYAQYDNSGLLLKYSIRNPQSIFEQVAKDLRDELASGLTVKALIF